MDSVTAVARKYLADGGNMVLDTASRYVGTGMRNVMEVLLLTSLFACLLSFHNIIARYQLVLGREGILPGFLAQTHSRHSSPHSSSLVQTITAVLLVGVAALSGADRSPSMVARALSMSARLRPSPRLSRAISAR